MFVEPLCVRGHRIALTWIKRRKPMARRLIQIKAALPAVVKMRLKLLRVQLVWSSTRIVWDQQILLLWILLIPVFLTSALLVFAAPLFFRDQGIRKVDNNALTGQPGTITETVERRAA